MTSPRLHEAVLLLPGRWRPDRVPGHADARHLAQSVEPHERFVAENGLNIPLLADEDKQVARAYGVVGSGGIIRRSVFLVDGDGTVRYRHVALFGLRYQDVGDIERAVELVR